LSSIEQPDRGPISLKNFIRRRHAAPLFRRILMKRVAALIGFAGIALSAAAASAQTVHATKSKHAASTGFVSTGTQTSVIVVQPNPYALGSNYAHAATADESWARGRADAIRALGEYDRNRAAAAIDWEAARDAAIENWKSQVRANWEIREEYKDRELAAHPPMTPEQQIAVTRARDPKRLTPSELSADGTINWPAALQAAEFESARSRLEGLFAERARGVSPAAASAIARQVDAQAIAMAQTLAGMSGGMDPLEQVAVGNFINSLRLEARLPLEAGIVANVAAVKQ
jgi:hypothetical protein